jgi:O-antigen/teichoic acid export membrane protein
MIVGSAVSGVLAYVFFALVTRALGASGAAPVSVLWSGWSLTGAALTFPLQHWLVRTVTAAAGQEGGVLRALPRVLALVAALAVLVTVAAWWGRSLLFHRDGLAFPVLVGALVVGSAVTGVLRGVLTARGRLAAVGIALVAENAVRCVLALFLMLAGSSDAFWFGLALVLGQVVALCWAGALRLQPGGGGDTPWLPFLFGAGGGQLVGQVVLTSGPVVLALIGGSAAEVTGLFAALALLRLPYTLALGAVSPLTAVFTRMATAGGDSALARVLHVLLPATVVASLAGASLAGPVGPSLLGVVFGRTVHLSGALCAVVAAGSVFAVGSLLLSLVVMARGRAGTMLGSWIFALAAAAGSLAIGPGAPVTTVAVTFLVSELAAFGALGLVASLHTAPVTGRSTLSS